MGPVGPMNSKNNDLKQGEKSSKSDENDKENSQNSGGNLDSGYHSFSCSSVCCCQKQEKEMISMSLGHEDDFPLPTRQDYEYQKNILEGERYKQNHVPVSDYEVMSDRGYSSLPDASLYSTRFNNNNDKKTFASPSSGKSYSRSEIPQTDERTKEQEAQKVEKKIEFCFKLGYTVEQVRAILLKIGYDASKNDILMALGNNTNQPGKLSTPDSEASSNESRGETVELIARGPLTIEDEGKDDEANASDNLRPIVIDGSNVAMSHGNKEYFSCKGIQLTVQYFLDRGHRDITVFVPNYRKEQSRPDAPIRDQEILFRLHAEKILVWTPSRHVNGRRITCYDDRFVLQLAHMTEGVIVSNDNFRDLQTEKPEWKEIIEKRLLMYSFVNDRFMPPEDPLGRNGPSLDNFLRIRSLTEEKKKPECPYGKKCTYGKKCKYFHPECPFSQRSVSEQIKDRPAPSTEARKLASEVIKERGQGSPQPGAQSKVSKQKISGAVSAQPRTDAGSISPSNFGAWGVTTSISLPASSLGSGSNMAQAAQVNSLAADFRNKMNLRPPHHYPSMGYPNFENNSNGAEGPNQMSRMGLPPPGLHSQVGRNVMSSANPHQSQHLQSQMNMHHSSPPAFPMYDRSYIAQHPSMNPYHQNLTYPTLAQQHMQPYPPMNQPYTNQDMILYHQAMAQHHIRLHQMAPPDPYGPHYPHYHLAQSQMLQQNNLSNPGSRTTPRHLDPSVYDDANRQHYSSPVPMAPHHMMPPNPAKPRSEFRDPSHPRYHLFKNLCGLFRQSTVERVMRLHPHENNPKPLAKECLELESELDSKALDNHNWDHSK